MPTVSRRASITVGNSKEVRDFYQDYFGQLEATTRSDILKVFMENTDPENNLQDCWPEDVRRVGLDQMDTAGLTDTRL